MGNCVPSGQPPGGDAQRKEVLQGAYQVNGNQITFGENTGPYACRTPGTYTWQMNNGQVTFTRLLDACKARVLALTSRPLSRRP